MGLHACGLIRSGGHIGFLAVEPGFQRQGLGKQLLHALRTACFEQYSVTRITVNADPEIQAFYLACGFECRGDMQTESGVSFLPMEKMFSTTDVVSAKKHTGLIAALVGGLIVGALAQKSRLCMAGGLRDVFLFRDFHLLIGFVAIFATVLVGNLIMGNFNPTLAVQPVAHHDYLWSFLGMAAAGWGSVLLGGCPLRQLILAGEGSGDSAVTVFGMLVGAALAHNFGMAGNADAMTDGVFTAGGVAQAGRIGIVIALVLLLIISIANIHREEKAK